MTPVPAPPPTSRRSSAPSSSSPAASPSGRSGWSVGTPSILVAAIGVAVAWLGVAGSAAPDLQAEYAAGVAAHQKRCLTEASRHYTAVLAKDPSRAPTDAERRLVLDRAPLLRRHAREFFALEDVVAILHPTDPVIAYHLFWDDDVDFPEDNDPTDHEIVWVEYDRGSRAVVRVATYFHGQVIEARGADIETIGDGRPVVGVEWGKHGSLPFVRDLARRAPPVLRQHWTQLHDKGTRLPAHPLARGWPTRFDGSWEDYCALATEAPTRPALEQRGFIAVSRWGNAVLNREFLPYNFAAKLDWPSTAPAR